MARGLNRGDIGVSVDFFPVTPDDAVDLRNDARLLMVSVGGTVHVTKVDGTEVTITVPAGVVPGAVRRVWATGTTATGITAFV